MLNIICGNLMQQMPSLTIWSRKYKLCSTDPPDGKSMVTLVICDPAAIGSLVVGL
jgi:hypothetical protein